MNTRVMEDYFMKKGTEKTAELFCVPENSCASYGENKEQIH